MKAKVSVLNEVRRCKLMLSFALTCAVGGMFSVARGEGPSQIKVSDYLPGAGSCVLDSIEELRVKVNMAKMSGAVVLAAATSADDVSVALNRGAVFLTGGQVSGSQFSGITATESTARGEDMTEAFPYRWLVEGPYFAYMGTGIPQVAGGLLKVNRDKIRANGGKAVDLVMLGDSISHFWPVNGPTSWATLDGNWSVFDFGGGSDRVQDTLYVAKWGYLDGYAAKHVSIMVGVNNLRDGATAEAIAGGISSLIGIVRTKQPNAKILLHAVLPYDAAGSTVRTKVAALNALLKPLADGTTVVWVDMTDDFINADGTFKSGMIRSDNIHPDEGGYAVWLGRLQQYLQQ